MKKMKIRGFTADTSLFCAGPASLFLRPVDGGFFSADNKKRADHKKGGLSPNISHFYGKSGVKS